MSFLDLDQRQEAQITEWAMANGTASVEPTPGFLDGSLSAPIKGAAKGLVVEPARALNLALSHVPVAVDAVAGTKSRDWWFEHMVGGMAPTVKALSVDPRATGMAGQLLHGFFDIGSQAVVGNMMGGPGGAAIYTGINKTIGGAATGIDEGLDAHTAMQKGAIEGAAAAVGVALPMTMTPMVGTGIPALLQQLGYGAAANVPLGIASRYLTHQTLEDGGYKDMAQQYKALDENALIADAVLGAAFGGLGHWMQGRAAQKAKAEADASDRARSLLGREPMPSEVDAALTVLKADHIEKSGPGLPKDAASRNAHVDAVTAALDDLIAGRRVAEHSPVLEAEFVPNRAADEARATIAQHFDDISEVAAIENGSPKRMAPFDAIKSFLNEHVFGKEKGADVPIQSFDVGTFPPSVIAKVAQFIDGFTSDYASVRVSSLALKHADEGHHKLISEVHGQLRDVVQRAEPEVLHNPKRENSAFLVYRRQGSSNALMILEIAKNGTGTDIVNIIPADARKLKQHERKSTEWLEGRQGKSQTPHQVSPRTPAEGEFSDLQPSGDANIAQVKVGAGGTALESASKDVQAGIDLAKPALKNLLLTDQGQHSAVVGQFQAAIRLLDELRAKGIPVIDYLGRAEGIPPEINNLLIGLNEANGNPKQIAALINRYADATLQRDGRQALDLTADSVDAVRADPNAPLREDAGGSTPEARQAADIAGDNPNLPVAPETLPPEMVAEIRKIKPEGPITAADVIAQSRADIELAKREKGVFDVAVTCFLRH